MFWVDDTVAPVANSSVTGVTGVSVASIASARSFMSAGTSGTSVDAGYGQPKTGVLPTFHLFQLIRSAPALLDLDSPNMRM